MTTKAAEATYITVLTEEALEKEIQASIQQQGYEFTGQSNYNGYLSYHYERKEAGYVS